ncbi:MAG: hypothetical protein ACFCUS_04175 [Rubrimonas sp.]|uniref:hypothetical protein n=1 Tax=Rubrimonas sp. TaxID=2036015 RepID=UPI002FDE4E74
MELLPRQLRRLLPRRDDRRHAGHAAPERSLSPRARAAALFGAAGLLAACAHVAVETPGALRDWRQTVPLAGLTGAALGWIGRPASAKAGAALAAAALAAFAALFALGHVAISGGDLIGSAADAARALFGAGGAAALALGALAGWAAGRSAPS